MARVVAIEDPETDLLVAARALLDEAFEGQYDDHDWAHAQGGLHVFAWDGDELVGYGALVERTLWVAGEPLRTGYIEALAAREDHQRRGIASQLMDRLEAEIRTRYELGALSAMDDAIGFYATRGLAPWRGPTSVRTSNGIKRTPEDDGGIYVLSVRDRLDTGAEITCNWREGDVW